jgi:hypothetical protein
MAVDVKTAAGTFDASEPDVSPDGQRFLVGQADREATPAVSLIMNWPELLRH